MFAPASRGSGRTRVKICGLTSEADSIAAIECGADALGFNLFRGSKRYVDITIAADWIRELPSDVPRVAVLVDPTRDEVMRLASTGVFTSVQLHGNESPEFCRALADAGVAFAKALAASPGTVPIDPEPYVTNVIVLDSASDEGFGGTGRVFPWEIARDFRAAYPRVQMILAGGLTPQNVAEAVAVAQPFGVDVTSGIELSPGRKDHSRLRAFIEAVHAAA